MLTVVNYRWGMRHDCPSRFFEMKYKKRGKIAATLQRDEREREKV